jgi:hypothetical protein
MPLLTPEISAKIGTLQTLDDAIAFRLNRLSLPCPDCAPGQRCVEHACDASLVAGYQERYAAAFQDAVADIDPDDIDRIMQHGDAIPPTVGLLSAAIIARLRQLAADGPAVTQLDGCPVVVEPDGTVVVEHPIAVDGGREAGS